MSQPASTTIAVMGIDIGKNSFHVVALDQRGAIVLRQRWSRGQVESRLANMPPCLIGMEACVGAHHLSRKLKGLGHDARLMPAKYVRPYSKGQKHDWRPVVRSASNQGAEAVQHLTTSAPTPGYTLVPAGPIRISREACEPLRNHWSHSTVRDRGWRC